MTIVLVSVAAGLIGLALTVFGKSKPVSIFAGVLKAGSTLGLAIVGSGNYGSTLVTIGLCLAVIGDVSLSVLNCAFKKDAFFLGGLGAYMVGYALIAAGVFMEYPESLTMVIVSIFAFIALPVQMMMLDKASGTLRVILVMYVSVITGLVLMAVLVGWVAFLGALLVYASDSVIGHSQFNSKYSLPSWLTETLITALYVVGLALFVIAPVI